jgi:uncharacterized membrane-anchored protein YhcB (DUF1043 family)
VSETLIQTVVGIFFTIVLGFLANRLGKILDNQTTMNTELIKLRKDTDNNTGDINALYSERDKEHIQELRDLKNQIRELKGDHEL